MNPSYIFNSHELNELIWSRGNHREEWYQNLMIIINRLTGSFSATGIRQWFFRPRYQLNERSPYQVINSIEASDFRSQELNTVFDLALSTQAGSYT